jgi:hypothetical protein
MAAGDATTISVLVKARDEASAALNRIASNGEKMAAGFAKHRRTIGMAAVGMGTALTGIGVAGIKAASDLGESMNAVNVIFGDGSKVIHEFGKTSARSAGLSTASFNQLASVTGALLKDVGLPMEEVAGLTTQLTVRAADMASVMNTSVEDALSAVGQALRGETEAIRRYAGDVTEASLEHFRLSEGMQKSVKDMSEQEKRLLRLDLIMKQTNIMAGDFANTQESLANQLRIAGAEFTNVRAAIGTALVPAVEKLMTKIGPLLKQLIGWIEKNPELAKWITIIAVGIGALLIPLGGLLLILPGLVAGFGLLAGAILPITAVVVALTAAIAIGIVIWKNWETMGMKLKVVFAVLFPPIVALIAIIKNWNTIIDKITLAFIFTKKVVLDIVIAYTKMELAVAKFTRSSAEQQNALKKTISDLENTKAADQDWADQIRANAQKRADAAQEEARVAEQAGEQTQDAQKGVIAKTLEKTGIMQDSSQKVQVAAQEEAQAVERASGLIIGTYAERRKKRDEFAAAEISAWQQEQTAARDAKDSMQKSIVSLMESLDENSVKWKEFGGSAEQVMKDWAKATNKSIEDVGREWINAEIDINNHEQILKEFHKRMGLSWFDYSENVKAANKRIEDATEALGQKVKGVFDKLPAMSAAALESMEEDLAIIGQMGETFGKGKQTGGSTAATVAAAAAAATEKEAMETSEKGLKELSSGARRLAEKTLKDHAYRAGVATTSEWETMTFDDKSMKHYKNLASQLSKQMSGDMGRAMEIYAEQPPNVKQKRAMGGPASGLTLVGERGPELVSLPGGSFVHKSGTGPGGQTNNFIFNGSVYGVEDLKDVVIEAVRDHAISGGFSGVFEEA